MIEFWDGLAEYMKENPQQRLGQAVENYSSINLGFSCDKTEDNYNCCFNNNTNIPQFMSALCLFLRKDDGKVYLSEEDFDKLENSTGPTQGLIDLMKFTLVPLDDPYKKEKEE